MKPELIIVGHVGLGTTFFDRTELEMARGIKIVQVHSIPSGPPPIQITNPLREPIAFNFEPKKGQTQNSNFTKPKKRRK